MLYIAICDDERDTLKNLSKSVREYLKQNEELAEITEYDQSRMLLYDIQEKKYFDLILTDIEMPEMDGMNLAAGIREYLPEALIIFITSHMKYAIDAYELSIFRYLPKNLLEERLFHAMKDAVSMIHMQSEQHYTITLSNRLEKIPYKQILYVYKEGKNSTMVLLDGTVRKMRKSLSQLYIEFQSKDFVYVDRGTMVNLAYIVSMKGKMLELKSGFRLSASDTKIEEIKEKLCTFWGEKI